MRRERMKVEEEILCVWIPSADEVFSIAQERREVRENAQ